MMFKVLFILIDMINSNQLKTLLYFITKGGFDLQLTTRLRPKFISSRTAQAIHSLSVTRATAAKPILVVLQITSNIDATVGMRFILSTSLLFPEGNVFNYLILRHKGMYGYR